MPELPEVETTVQGIKPYVEGQVLKQVTVRQPRLRWPVPETLSDRLPGQKLHTVYRRAKYLVFKFDNGFLLIHLGMSGHLRLLDTPQKAEKHDHVDFIFSPYQCLRYTDPRRFGAIVWSDLLDINQHPLLNHLGPEPLSPDFSTAYLCQQLRQKQSSIKQCIMNGDIVVGVGNIYANEALFLARIHPKTPAHALTQPQIAKLVSAIKSILKQAITAGGTTLKDFKGSNGKPGYFSRYLHIYGKADQPCPQCQSPILRLTQAQRASYFCPNCQPLIIPS